MSENTKKYINLIIVSLPVVFAIVYIKIFAVNVLYWDEYSTIDLVANNKIDFQSIFAQHNEHRQLFGRIVYYIIAKVTNMNSIAQMYCSIFLVATVYITMIFYLKTIMKEKWNILYALLLGFLIFNPIQYENFLWGFQLFFIMVYVFSIQALFFVYRSINSQGHKSVAYFLIALICAIIASFSSIHGLMLWIAVSAVWLFHKRKNVLKNIKFHIWNLVALSVWIGYFLNYHKPEAHPSITYALKNPIAFLSYLCSLIGSGLFTDIDTAIVFGLIIIVISLCIFIWFIISNYEVDFFVVGVMIFGLLVDTSIAIGRAGFGINQSTASRYTTYSLIIVESIYLFMISKRNIVINKKINLNLDNAFTYYRVITVFILLISFPISAMDFFKAAQIDKSRKVQNQFLLSTYETQPTQLLIQLFPDADAIKRYSQILQAHSYNVFSKSMNTIPKTLSIKENAIRTLDTPPTVIDINTVKIIQDEKEPYITISSWAVDPMQKNVADSVYICFGEYKYKAFYGVNRQDVANHFKTPKYLYSGYERSIPIRVIKDGVYPFKLQILSEDLIHYYDIKTNFQLTLKDGVASFQNVAE